MARSRSNDGSPDGLSINGYEGVFFSTGSNSYQERFGIDVSGNISVGGTNIISQSRNLTNIGTISSGAITSTGNSSHGGYSSWTAGSGTSGIFMHYNSSNSYRGYFDWRTLQLGNNGANNILFGNSATGGYAKFYVNSSSISQNGGTSGTHAFSMLASGEVVKEANERFTIKSHSNSWDGGLRMISQDGTDTFQMHPDNNGWMYVDKIWNFTGDIKINGVTVIASNRALDNISNAYITNGGALYNYTSIGNLRGFIQAVETGGGTAAGLVIATSGGETISFKDGGLSGTLNAEITGGGDLNLITGTLDINGTTVIDASRNGNFNGLRIQAGTSNYNNHTDVDEYLVQIQDSYNAAGSHSLNVVNWNGNWTDGTSGSDSAYGLHWGYENSTRAGIHYDHRGTEKFDFYSSYGAIRFRLPASASGNLSPISGSYNDYLTISPGGAVEASANIRAPIFYDSNNTAYYVDPASTSTSFKGQGLTDSKAGFKSTSNPWNTSDSAFFPNGITTNNSTNWIYGHCYLGNAPSNGSGNEATAAGTIESTSWHKATLYYDRDNTAYRIDANSDSKLHKLDVNWIGAGRAPNSSGSYRLTMGGSIDMNNNHIHYADEVHFHSNTRFRDHGANYLDFRWGSSGSGGIRMIDGSENLEGYLYADNGNIGLLSSNGSWAVQCTNAKTLINNRLDTPIVYDRDNTGFYFDGSSSTTSVRINGDVLIDQQYGKGVVGVYSSTVLQHVWSMGGAYRLAANGSTAGNMYGMAWSHPNAGTKGGANHLNDHGLLIINNGSFRAAISSRAVFSEDVRGTLFYDYNDTAYYVDPASTSISGKFRQTVIVGDGSQLNSNDGSWGARLNLTDSVHSKIEIGQDANSVKSYWWVHTGHDKAYFGTATNHHLEFQTSGTTRLKIDKDGGTTNTGDLNVTGDVQSNKYEDVGGTFLFKKGSGTGRTRHLNLADSTSDPSAITDAMNPTGISWGQRSDNNGYYMLGLKGAYNNGYSNYSRLVVGWHTGLEIGSNPAYGGTRFFSDSPFVTTTEIMSVGRGDSHVRVENNLYCSGVTETPKLYLNGGNYEGSIVFGAVDVWRCGIRQHDDGDAELRIWAKHAAGRVHIATGYDGQPASISRPTDGFVVNSNNVGIGNFSAIDPSEKLHVLGNARFDNGTSTTLDVKCDNGGTALVRASGDGQGTGAFEVTQDTSYGGGMSYNGDGSPTWVSGETADHITFYRMDAGSRTEVFHYPYDSNAVSFNGEITAAGNITAYSDRKLKENIEPIENAVNKVQQLNGVTFNRNDLEDTSKRYAGLIAQDVEQVLPEAVEGEETLAVDYNATIGLLVEAIKELKSEVDDLKTQLSQKEK